MDALTQKQRLFSESYYGDVVTAMQLAGYVGDPATLQKNGSALMQDPRIVEAIQERARYSVKTKEIVADREERQAFWTAIMRNDDPHHIAEQNEYGVVKAKENLGMSQRMKASEMLGKSEADFVERHVHEGNVTLSTVIEQSYMIPDADLDIIEAEYNALNNKSKEQTIEEKAIEINKVEEKPEEPAGAGAFI